VTRIVALLDRREPAHAVAIARIVFGVAIVLHLARLLRTEAWRWVLLSPKDGGLVAVDDGPLRWIGGATPDNVHLVLVGTLVAAALLALGLVTPLAAAAVALGWSRFTHLGPNAGGSYDHLGGAVLWLLVFAGSGGALSLDAWFRRLRGHPPATAPAGIRWLLVWQLVCMYDSTAWHKLSAGWMPWGEKDALWYILQQPTWQRFDMEWLAPLYPVTQIGTVSTWIFEHLSPTLLLAAWFRHTRTRDGWFRAQFNRVDWRLPFLGFGLVLHASIEATMEVGAFTPFTLALYAACFSGEEVCAALARCRSALRV
jgi:hypothetical protein